MAGLSDYLTDTAVTTEKMPSWFTTAQQNLMSDVNSAVTPTLASTTAQKAINAFGDTGPFSTGQSMLETIGSGAANPWITTTDASGAVTSVAPNMGTALGGLFGAQQQYLNQIMPDIDAAETARSIAGGGFGSRMNLSGVARERSKAASDLFQKQMAAALQNQQVGVQAGTGLGNLGAQLTKGALETGAFQQGYPYANLINESNIIGKVGPTVPKTTEQSKRLSVLGQIGGLGQLISGAPTGLQNIQTGLSSLWDRLTGTGAPYNLTFDNRVADPTVPGDWVY